MPAGVKRDLGVFLLLESVHDKTTMAIGHAPHSNAP